MKNVASQTYSSLDYIQLEDLKDHLRVTDSANDNYLSNLLDSCFSYLSDLLGYEVRKSMVEYFFSGTNLGVLHIPARILSITNVKYRDTAGDLQTLSASDYDEILTISANYGYDITIVNAPSLYDYGWRYKVTVVEGFAKPGDSVDTSKIFPEILRAAIYRLAEDLYTQRGDMMVGVSASQLPVNIDNFISKYQIKEFV